MIVSKIITRILNKLNRFDESKTAIYLIKRNYRIYHLFYWHDVFFKAIWN